MLIQVDVDSTLYDANALFYEVGTEEGIDWPKIYYYWFGPTDIGTDLTTLKNVFRKCHSEEYVMEQKPYPGAAEILAKIVDEHDDVHIAYVSDRNSQQTSALQKWLDANGFLHTDDQVVIATKDKREWMRENKPDIVIDDRIRTMLLARYELGSYVASIEHPHNMNLRGEAEGIYLVKDWKAMAPVLEELVAAVETKVFVDECVGRRR